MTDKTDSTNHAYQNIQRSVLPIPDQPYKGTIVYDAKNPDAKFPPIQPIRPPKEAPNVLLILLDDVGFGASSAFGGPINTPVAESLATGGLKYTRFHTTALCSPTRAAILNRTKSPYCRHGVNHRNCNFCSRL